MEMRLEHPPSAIAREGRLPDLFLALLLPLDECRKLCCAVRRDFNMR
jgi:hypothetical protein